MNLLLLTFGPNIKNHYQANFCILSLLARQQELAFTAVYVYTDHPEFYRHLGDYVKIVPLTKDMLQEWKGEHQYLFRIKIKALEHFIISHGEVPVMYLDSDTFLYQNTQNLKQLLSDNVALMHEEEGKLAQQKSKTVLRMWEMVKGKTFADIPITENETMWNSGVIGIPATRNQEAIQLALRICDEMLQGKVTSFMLEQFAVSIALNNIYNLQPAHPSVGHYWAAKDTWNEAISNFFLESKLKAHTIEQDIERMRQFNFKALPIRNKMKNTKLRLQRMLEKLFPPKEVVYLD
ncbi:hypothetical protein [Pontibacter sp. H249]|uniref:hypothetical protein n=1 Tax=Pontibacter sp. H249 TaxID=3133420 RepID=UPI0030BDE2B5